MKKRTTRKRRVSVAREVKEATEQLRQLNEHLKQHGENKEFRDELEAITQAFETHVRRNSDS